MTLDNKDRYLRRETLVMMLNDLREAIEKNMYNYRESLAEAEAVILEYKRVLTCVMSIFIHAMQVAQVSISESLIDEYFEGLKDIPDTTGLKERIKKDLLEVVNNGRD